MDVVDEELINKGEFLRSLYLMRELIHSLNPITIYGFDTRNIFKTTLDKIEDLIPSVERELPSWAVEMARKTFDTRRGFIIWEEKLKELDKKVR